MSIMQTDKYYTGCNDPGTVKLDSENKPASDYARILQGKTMQTITAPKEREPLIIFQVPNTNGSIKETYFVQGQYYFKQGDKTFRPISELSSIFGGIPIYSITFGGYLLCDADNKMVYMARVNNELYVTGPNGTYKKNQGDYFKDLYFIYSEDAITGAGFGRDGKTYFITFSFDAQHNITVDKKIFFPAGPELYFLKPTGCYRTLNGSLALQNTTLVNKDYVYAIDPGSSTGWTAGILQVSGTPAESIGCGEYFHYQVNKTTEPGSILLTNSMDTYLDDCKETTAFTYNSRFQIKKSSYTNYALNHAQKSFILQQAVDRETEYLWESSQPAAEIAKDTAVGLISQTSEKTTQGDVSRYSNKTRKTYQTRGGITDATRIYYVKTEKMDGLNGDKWTQSYNINALCDFGQPYMDQGVYTPEMSVPLTNKYLYAGNTYLHIADFSNIHVNSQTGGQSAHYLGFESYQDYSISNETLNNVYFTAAHVELIDTSFIGSHSLRFKQAGQLKITATFNAIDDTDYVFSCWRRLSNNDAWRYFTKIIPGTQLKENKIIHNFNAGHDICHIMLREVNTTAQVLIYDPQTFRLKVTMNNNGIPTIMVYDRLERQQFSYTPELIRDTSSNTENYFKTTGNMALSPFTLTGYARFQGFNCEKTITENSGLFNSALNAVFPEKAVTIPPSGGSITGLNTKTLFAAGAWLTSEQTLTITRAQDTKIELLLQGQTASLRVGDQTVATSEKYVADQSAWSIFISGKIVTVFINGKLLLSYVLTASSTINSVSTSTAQNIAASAIEFNNILIAAKVDLTMSYFDYAGNLIQTQKIRDDRILLSQNFYDRHGNLAVSTMPGFYPLLTSSIKTTDRPFAFRDQFALMDFSSEVPRGTLSGELANFFNSAEGREYCELDNDYKWPYTCHTHENNTVNRLVSTIEPGEFGSRMQESNLYHDSDTYQNYAAQFGSIQNEDYSSNIRQYVYPNITEKLTSSQINDISGNRYGTQILGYKNKNNNEETIKQTIDTELGVFVSDKTTSLSSYSRYYEINDTTFTMERSLSTANRLRYSNSPDSGLRGILCDSLGNDRLSISNGDTKFKYTKYDILGRTVESGTVVLTGSLKDYIDKVNNPSFPTSSDGTLTPYYRCFYNTFNNTLVDFGMAKLCSVENISSGVTTSYQYDYLGRTVSVKNSTASKNSTTTYEYNIAGKPVKIVYPVSFGYQTEYTYDGVGNISSIILKKTDGSKSYSLLSQAKYDIFDSLHIYINAQNQEVFNKRTMYGHLTEIGDNSTVPEVKKYYCSHVNPDLPNQVISDNENSTQITTLGYDALQRLISFEIENNTGVTSSSYTYDIKGNLTSSSTGGATSTFTYSGNRLTSVKNSTGTTIATMSYAQDGLLSSFTKAQESYTLTRDDFYASKYKTITRTAPALSLNFTYDFFGNKLTEVSGSSSLLYGYSNANQLDFIEKNGSYGNNSLYIYCGTNLITEFHTDTDDVISLMYDNMMSLSYLSYTKSNTVTAKAFSYVTPWGKFTGYGTDIPKVTFIYGGMQYLEPLDCYEIDGEILFTEYGVSSTPSLSQTIQTPYRPFHCQPIH